MKTKMLWLLLFTIVLGSFGCGSNEPTEEQKKYEPIKYDITRYNKASVNMGQLKSEPDKYRVRYALTVSTTKLDAGEGVVLSDVHFAYIVGIANYILEKNVDNVQLEVITTYSFDNGNEEKDYVLNREIVANFYETFKKGVKQNISTNEGQIEITLPNLTPKNALKFKSFTDKIPYYEE